MACATAFSKSRCSAAGRGLHHDDRDHLLAAGSMLTFVP